MFALSCFARIRKWAFRVKGRSFASTETSIFPLYKRPYPPLRTLKVTALRHAGMYVAAAAAMMALTACTVGPNYVRPSTPVPPAFKEISGWKMAEPKEAAARGPWWEVYGDPRLSELEAQVAINNQNVAMAEAQFRAARAQVSAARAAYFPTVTVGASFTRSQQSSTLGGGRTRTATAVNDYNLPIGVSWEPDIWGKVRRSVESSRAAAQASAADLAAATLSFQAELAGDYFQMWALDGEKRLLDDTVAYYKEFLKLTKNRYASGVASQADVAAADTQLKTTEAQAVDIGVQRAQLEHAIALLTGTPASVFNIPAMPPNLAAPPDIPVGLPSELLERRPDIAAAERLVAAANAQIGVAVSAYYPTVTLSASGGFQSSDLGKWLSWPSRFWSFGPSAVWTIFDGGLRRAQTEAARAAYDAQVAAYRETTLAAFGEVEDSLASLRILEEEAAAQDEAVKAAEESLSITTNQYKAGTQNYLNVLTAQAAVLSNRRTAIDILGRRLTSSVLLVKALGGGWDASQLPKEKDLGLSKAKDSGGAGK